VYPRVGLIFYLRGLNYNCLSVCRHCCAKEFTSRRFFVTQPNASGGSVVPSHASVLYSRYLDNLLRVLCFVVTRQESAHRAAVKLVLKSPFLI
jgi:hypothetical protein